SNVVTPALKSLTYPKTTSPEGAVEGLPTSSNPLFPPGLASEYSPAAARAMTRASALEYPSLRHLPYAQAAASAAASAHRCSSSFDDRTYPTSTAKATSANMTIERIAARIVKVPRRSLREWRIIERQEGC